MLVCYFFVRGHLVASFFFGGFEIGDLRSFPCFASFIFIVLLVLPLFALVCTKCFGCDFVSGCVLVYDWFANILVDVLKLRWHCWLHFDISFNVRVWLSISWRSCYCPPVICPLVSAAFIIGTTFSLMVISRQFILMLSNFVLIDSTSFWFPFSRRWMLSLWQKVLLSPPSRVVQSASGFRK